MNVCIAFRLLERLAAVVSRSLTVEQLSVVQAVLDHIITADEHNYARHVCKRLYSSFLRFYVFTRFQRFFIVQQHAERDIDIPFCLPVSLLRCNIVSQRMHTSSNFSATCRGITLVFEPCCRYKIPRRTLSSGR